MGGTGRSPDPCAIAKELESGRRLRPAAACLRDINGTGSAFWVWGNDRDRIAVDGSGTQTAHPLQNLCPALSGLRSANSCTQPTPDGRVPVDWFPLRRGRTPGKKPKGKERTMIHFGTLVGNHLRRGDLRYPAVRGWWTTTTITTTHSLPTPSKERHSHENHHHHCCRAEVVIDGTPTNCPPPRSSASCTPRR